MTNVQKGVFLTVTDLLGKRSFVLDTSVAYTKAVYDGCDPYGTDCYNGCMVDINDEFNDCVWVSGQECYRRGLCSATETRLDFQQALDHVTRIWAVRDGSGCGGIDDNRMFFSADDTLMYVIRNFGAGLPEWSDSDDPQGPHWPFTNSSETVRQRPEGQMHFWAWDYQAQTLWSDGLEGVYDPHIVEIDIDYNTRHHSNPECYYDGIYGRIYYQNYWRNYGMGGSAELDYNACQ